MVNLHVPSPFLNSHPNSSVSPIPQYSHREYVLEGKEHSLVHLVASFHSDKILTVNQHVHTSYIVCVCVCVCVCVRVCGGQLF